MFLELVLLYMKKLKILLLFSFLFFYRLQIRYHYNPLDDYVVGTIVDYKIKENYTVIDLKEIIVYYYGKFDYKIGDTIRVDGTIKKIEPNTNFNLFNYQKYMLSKRIVHKIEAKKITLIKENKSVLYQIKNKIKERVMKHKYFEVFIIGENNLETEVKDSFKINGISHLFAISGMHITLFVSLLVFVLEKVTKNKKIVFFFIMLFLLFYMFITNYAVSVVRASLFVIFTHINKLYKLNCSTLELFFFIFLICICYNPYYVYQVGFLFTFLITFTLLLFHKKIPKNYFFKMFVTSFISFLVSIPILINNFYSVNFLSPILNLLFIPLITFIIFPFTLITFLFPNLIGVLDKFVYILEYLSLHLSKIHLFIFSFKKVSFFFLILYYIVIYFILNKILNKKYQYIFLFVMILIIHYHYNFFDGNTKVTMLDVGQGDSILMELEHGKGSILIDTGGIFYKDQVNNILIPYFKSIGVKKINYLILTHGDYDHIGNAINLVDNFKVDNVIFNCGDYNNLEKELIEVLNKKKIKYYSCIKELNIDDNKLYFLNTKEYNNENDNSNVIYTELNGYKFMFMGDAGIEKEEDILDKYNLSNIDVLKVGHHGSRTSSSKEFIDEINPKYSIISVGKNNRYGHPNKEVLNNLKQSNVYRTDQDGSIMFKIKNDKLKIETCSP